MIDVCVRTENWEWCYSVKPENLVRTLRKLLRKYRELAVWLSPEKDYYWYWIANDKQDLERFLRGEPVQVIYHTEHPFFRGCKAYGRATVSLEYFTQQ